MKEKQWLGPEKCAGCDQLKTTYHILFQCPIAVYLWPFLRNSLGWLRSPTSCVEFFSELLEAVRGKKKQKVTLFICVGAMSTIWKTRNDVVFNEKLLSSPQAIIFKTLILIKSWSPLVKPKLKLVADEMISLLSTNAKFRLPGLFGSVSFALSSWE